MRRLYRDGDSHLRAILTAGVVSDAKYEAMQGQMLERCSWCNSDVPSTWFHVVSDRSVLQKTRPSQSESEMQQWMGWLEADSRDVQSALI